MTKEAQEFAKELRAALDNARCSPRQLSLKIGVHPSYINRILTGERNPPSKKVVEKIAKVLNVDKNTLLITAGKSPYSKMLSKIAAQMANCNLSTQEKISTVIDLMLNDKTFEKDIVRIIKKSAKGLKKDE